MEGVDDIVAVECEEIEVFQQWWRGRGEACAGGEDK